MANDREDDSDLETGLFSVPDVYADGLAAIHNVGDTNFRAVYFTWVRNAGGVYERVVVAKIIRPKSSLRPGYVAKQLARLRHIRPPNTNRGVDREH